MPNVRRSSSSYTALVALVTTAAFFLGRYTADWPAYTPIVKPNEAFDPDSGPPLEQLKAGFSDAVQTWNRYVKDHDGFLPSDPYRFLADTNVVNSMGALKAYQFAKPLPPRINPDLTKNAKRPILWFIPYDGLGEVWVCYSNGTWAQRPLPERGVDWRALLSGAGYPVDLWRTWNARANWIAQNGGRLVWNERERLYVLAR